jgi:hypothetical protein
LATVPWVEGVIQASGHIVLVLVLVLVLEFRCHRDLKEHENEPKIAAALNRTALLTRTRFGPVVRARLCEPQQRSKRAVCEIFEDEDEDENEDEDERLTTGLDHTRGLRRGRPLGIFPQW